MFAKKSLNFVLALIVRNYQQKILQHREYHILPVNYNIRLVNYNKMINNCCLKNFKNFVTGFNSLNFPKKKKNTWTSVIYHILPVNCNIWLVNYNILIIRFLKKIQNFVTGFNSSKFPTKNTWPSVINHILPVNYNIWLVNYNKMVIFCLRKA